MRSSRRLKTESRTNLCFSFEVGFVRKKSWSQALPTCAKACGSYVVNKKIIWHCGSLALWIKNTRLHQQLFIGPPDHGRPVSLGTWQHLTFVCELQRIQNIIEMGEMIHCITWTLIMHSCPLLAAYGNLPSSTVASFRPAWLATVGSTHEGRMWDGASAARWQTC